MKFLFIWLLGDIANLSGALWTKLAPTTVALATYFCFADLILISQCSYYNTLNARRRSRSTRRRRLSSTATHDTDTTAVSDGEPEEEPLLSRSSRRRRSESLGLPGSHRRHSVRRGESNLDPLTRIITGEDDTPDSNPWLHNTLSIVAVWAVGAAGWFISYKMGAWDGGVPSDGGESAEMPEKTIGMVLGYFSAVCYLWYVVIFFFSFPSWRPLADDYDVIAPASPRSSRTTRKSRARASRCCSSCCP